MDPIFSTGVCLGMMGAVQAAEAIGEMLRHEKDHARHEIIRRRYCKYVDGSSSVFFRLVSNFYQHSFRELFLNGSGPMNVHGAVIGVLAGHVFPRPDFSLRWRLRLFDTCMWLNRGLPMVPRRQAHSLLCGIESEDHDDQMQGAYRPTSPRRDRSVRDEAMTHAATGS